MTEPTVATKGSNSDFLGNRSSGFQLPESELRPLLPHESFRVVKQNRPTTLSG
ncbi:MAG: hypothetical protein WBI53_03580 [Paludibacter sp.]